MNVDDAYERAKTIIEDAKRHLVQIRSEEDAKLQIITRLLTEALGWAYSDIASESANQNGFSDYLISDGERQALVVEAKKIGVIDIATSATTQGLYKISGPVLKPALIGIAQAASYCHPLGV